jgi:hypothetical protein
VIDVEYRLVPEHAFPIGVQDSFAALQYIHSNGEKFISTPAASRWEVFQQAQTLLWCVHISPAMPICLCSSLLWGLR